MLQLSCMSLAPEQSCDFIYEMKQVKSNGTKLMAAVNPAGPPTLRTCCHAKLEAVLTMPLAEGIWNKKPLIQVPAPQKEWEEAQGGWGQQLYCSATLF